MGDRIGLFVMLGVLILIGTILVVMRPRTRTKDAVEHETLNPDVEASGDRAAVRPDAGKLVGNPPVDTVSPSGEDTAVAGAGAGGETSDARNPLRSSPNDAGNSPDQS